MPQWRLESFATVQGHMQLYSISSPSSHMKLPSTLGLNLQEAVRWQKLCFFSTHTSQYFTELLNDELVDAFCCPSVALPTQKQRKEKMKSLTTFMFLTYATTIHPVSLKPQRVLFMSFNNAVTFILWSILKAQSTRSQFCSAYKRLLKQAPITCIKKIYSTKNQF